MQREALLTNAVMIIAQLAKELIKYRLSLKGRLVAALLR
jgi:hypothetical protein